MEAFYESGQRRLYTLNAVQTNDLGEFSIFCRCHPASYYVSAVPEDPQRQNVSFSVVTARVSADIVPDAMPPVISRKNLPDGSFTEDVYAPVYFGGGPDPRRAQKITVAPGSRNTAELSFAGALDRIVLRPRGYAVNGVTGQPAESAQIRLYPQKWTATAVVPYARVDKNGNSRHRRRCAKGLLCAVCILFDARSECHQPDHDPRVSRPISFSYSSIRASTSEGLSRSGARIPVEMGNQNIEGVSVNLLPGGTLERRIHLRGNCTSNQRSRRNRSPCFESTSPGNRDIPGATLQAAHPPARNRAKRHRQFIPHFRAFSQGDFRVMVSPLIEMRFHGFLKRWRILSPICM